MIDSRSGAPIPKLGWSEVITAHASGLTQGTTSIIDGGSYTTWIKSFVLDIDSAAAGETVSITTSSGLTVVQVVANPVKTISHLYSIGWPVPVGDNIELKISGGGPSVSVAVEVMRKLANNSQT